MSVGREKLIAFVHGWLSQCALSKIRLDYPGSPSSLSTSQQCELARKCCVVEIPTRGPKNEKGKSPVWTFTFLTPAPDLAKTRGNRARLAALARSPRDSEQPGPPGRTSFAKRGDSTFCPAGQAVAAVAGSGGGVTMKVWGQCKIVRLARGERG